MIEDLNIMLECYNSFSLSLPLIERIRVLGWLVRELSPSFHLPVWSWDSSGKFSTLFWSEEGQLQRSDEVEVNDSISALSYIEQQPCGIFILENLPSLLAKEGIGRLHSQLVNLVHGLDECTNKYLILLDTNETPLSASLSALIPQRQLPLPEVPTILELIEESFQKLGVEMAIDIEPLAIALAGLSETEIQLGIKWACLSKKSWRCDSSWLELLLDYKMRRFRAFGLNFVPHPSVPMFGGMDRLKTAIAHLRSDFSPDARKHNIPLPKGWLLVGPPGTGKSLAVKMTALMLGFPLVNAEIGAIIQGRASYLESLIRRLEATAPVVVWLDEFDKFFIGDGESGAETGNSAQILGVLLNWLQEKRSKVFVVAALNRLSVLPPELTRSGRFDKIFYVDFPQAYERKEIFELYLQNYQDSNPLSESDWRRLLNATVKCSGAEIFEIVKNAAREQYYALYRQDEFHYHLGLSELLQAREALTPLYSRDTDRIIAMENQAKYIAEPVSSPDESMWSPPLQSLWGDKV